MLLAVQQYWCVFLCFGGCNLLLVVQQYGVSLSFGGCNLLLAVQQYWCVFLCFWGCTLLLAVLWYTSMCKPVMQNLFRGCPPHTHTLAACAYLTPPVCMCVHVYVCVRVCKACAALERKAEDGAA